MTQAFDKDAAPGVLNRMMGLEQPLGRMQPGNAGRIVAVTSDDRELERGLLEMGFVEGAGIEVLHQGWLRRDPLAVRINQQMTVALRRCEANAVLIGPLPQPAMTLAAGQEVYAT